MKSLSESAREARTWLVDRSAPLWSARGVATGKGFLESLTAAGDATPSGETRVRVQARQIHFFAVAGDLGWDRGRSAELANFGAETLVERCRRPDGLFGRTLDLDAGLVDATADLYDNAFALFGLAWAHRAGGERGWMACFVETLSALDTLLAHPAGGYAEALPARLPRRQNPHMHLFEALLAAHDATGERSHLQRADHIGELLRTRWLHDDGLGEYFDDAWAPAAGPDGVRMEPGHMFEWAWLLSRRAAVDGEAPPPEARRLYEQALDTCFDPYGFTVQEVARDGRVLDASRRTWPQTEALKAHLAFAEAGDNAAVERGCRVWAGLKTEYLDPAPAGGWIDRYDAEGRPAAADIPASTGYHVAGAIAELVRVAQVLDDAGPRTSRGAAPHAD